MTTRFVVHPEIIDPTPGRRQNNLIEPERDGLTSGPEEAVLANFSTNDVVNVRVVTKDGHWDTVASVDNIYQDEYGTLLGVSVDWGKATLVA